MTFCPIASGQQLSASNAESRAALRGTLESSCWDCHSGDNREGNLALDELLKQSIGEQAAIWEGIVRKLDTRQMPPLGETRPSESEYEALTDSIVQLLDRAAADQPNPGRTESLRRLTQLEYQFAIRDLLALDIDTSEMLPADESSHGFDNITVTGLSPVLLDRYVSAAQAISRLAIGVRAEPGAEKTYRMRPDITQDTHLEGTPIGSRGGIVVNHVFPQDGNYELQAWLMRDRNEELEGMHGTYELQFLVDRKLVTVFSVAPPPRGQSDKLVDANFTASVSISAGPHEVAVVFPKNPSSLLETIRQPLNVHFNYYRHPRIEPAVYQLTVRGPFEGKVPKSTPSRDRIFVCYPSDQEQEVECAQQIIRKLARLAYRRDVTDEDLEQPMEFFKLGQAENGFEAGVERALAAILVNPQFLFRIERQPNTLPLGAPYRLTAVELASRLSFFLWSSIPDEELLDLAANDQLLQPAVLQQQVQRMLADARAKSLVQNFADQWLYLRNLDSAIPDMRLFPDFDDNLRQSMRQETELFFESVVREDRSILDLLRADYTFLNERLAKHYGMEHIYGSHFRRVDLNSNAHRGGLLRQASILTVTSYATRTSPVLRGQWVLKNLIGSPPPAPPPNVPTLEENTVAGNLPVRARLEMHRDNVACAGCHNLIDPVGFALENFDAVGRWRDSENGTLLDVAGGLPDGSQFDGVTGLEDALLARPQLFVQTLTEKLMTYALGRGVEPYDAPAIRQIVREAKEHDFEFSYIISGIANSLPFQMRNTQ
ncbi:MAG: DUF1592 domain-containing protein [Planctomycetales bacterium]|nr:DUF1592 domain-containing protein [Planctomycetales bacterium]